MSSTSTKEQIMAQWVFHGTWVTAALLGMHWALYAGAPPRIAMVCEVQADKLMVLTARCSSQPGPG